MFVVFTLFLIGIDCMPLNENLTDISTPLERRVLENPNLFGGDMAGIDIQKLFMQTNINNTIPDDNRLWPMGYIPYVIGSDLADKKSLILEAMNRYHQNTCIRFMERTTEYDYIYLAKVDGCSSYVGRIGGKQLLSLSDGCHNVGTIVHELGHVVGFYHEHQRSDRDQYLEIYTQNIRANYEGQFTKLGPNDNRLIVPFDFNSIMLYGPLAFSKDSISKTMGPKAQYSSERMVEVNEKYGLSKLDITAVQKLYQC